MQVLDTILTYLADSGFGRFHWTNAVMIAVGLGFIALAVRKGFEPLLLVPIGFGIVIGNIPYDASRLALGVNDGPVSEADLAYYRIEAQTQTQAQAQPEIEPEPEPGLAAAPPAFDSEAELLASLRDTPATPLALAEIDDPALGRYLASKGEAIVANTHDTLAARRDHDAPGVYPAGQGRHAVVLDPGADRHPELWSLEKQDPRNASVFWWLFAGVGLAGFYPPLIFLGIGALTDFGPVLSNPKTLLLGAAAQFGIFAALVGALALGFSPEQAASIGIIGGADGPTAIFTASRLAPELLGAVALAAYSYMAMVPIIQPPIIKLLTTKAERRIAMPRHKDVPQAVKIVFPVAAFILTAMIAPGGLPLLGMLFFGNLLRESLVTTRLMKTAQGPFIDIVTILLGVTVGAKTSAATFLTGQTIGVFALGIAAFALATAAGVLAAKLLNAVSTAAGGEPVNPMIGAAGVSAVPMAARVVHRLGQDEDPQNFLLMHAMGPNVAGVIGSAVAAGVLLSTLTP